VIFDRIGIWRAMFPAKDGARETAGRWLAAASRAPELQEDLIRLGGLLTLQPVDPTGPLMNDPLRLAYEAGRRDLAIALLSMMALTPLTLTHLMEDNEK
jgi:hypothetical protein